MKTGRRIVKNMVSLLISGILAQLLIFFTSIYLARVLGPENFGKINFAMAIVVFFTLMTNMGLPLLGTREIARDMERIYDYTKSILTLRLFLAVSSFSLLVFLAIILKKSPDTKHLIILYGICLIPSALLLDWVFQGVEKMEYIGMGRILGIAVYSGLVFAFVKTSKQILFVPCFQIAGNFIFVAILVLLFSRHIGTRKTGSASLSWKSLLFRAFPIGMTSIMSVTIYYLDTVMLGLIKTNTEVGFYNAAYKIILLLIMGIVTYHDSIFPILVKFHETSFDSLSRLHSFTLKLMVTCAVPISIGGTILSKRIITAFYGEQYSEAAIAFKILIFACSLIFINTAFSRGLFATGNEKECLYIVTMQGVIAVILNFILIPSFGLIGGAVATVSGETLSLFMYHNVNNRIYQFRVYNYFFKPVLACIPMGFVLFLFADWHLFILIILGISIYSVILYLIKGVTMEEIHYLKNAIFKV